MATARASGRNGAKRKNQPLRVGDRVRFPYGPGEVKAEVIEDRGNLGIGGRQIVRVRILGRAAPADADGAGAGIEADSVEVPAEEVNLIGA